jgi:hypothetical protein
MTEFELAIGAKTLAIPIILVFQIQLTGTGSIPWSL